MIRREDFKHSSQKRSSMLLRMQNTDFKRDKVGERYFKFGTPFIIDDAKDRFCKKERQCLYQLAKRFVRWHVSGSRRGSHIMARASQMWQHWASSVYWAQIVFWQPVDSSQRGSCTVVTRVLSLRDRGQSGLKNWRAVSGCGLFYRSHETNLSVPYFAVLLSESFRVRWRRHWWHVCHMRDAHLITGAGPPQCPFYVGRVLSSYRGFNSLPDSD